MSTTLSNWAFDPGSIHVDDAGASKCFAGPVALAPLGAAGRHRTDATQGDGTGASNAGPTREVEIKRRGRATLECHGPGSHRHGFLTWGRRSVEHPAGGFVDRNRNRAHALREAAL